MVDAGQSPVHEVQLAAFFLARHELTQEQWLRLVGGDNPSRYKPGDPGVTLANPVEQIDWLICWYSRPGFPTGPRSPRGS